MKEHEGTGNFSDKHKAAEAGKKGGKQSGSGSFKNDPQKASEAGKKGGSKSSK